MVRMILAARKTLMLVHTKFKPRQSVIRQIYLQLLGVTSRLAWKCLMFQNKARPKAVFTMWLHLHGRLLTADRLLKWVIVVEPNCILCIQRAETKEHLFIKCLFTFQIWTKIFTWLGWNGQYWSNWDHYIE